MSFSFDLSATSGGIFVNFFPEGSIVTVNNVLLGDINRDGVVNLLDVEPFVDLITNGEFQFEVISTETELLICSMLILSLTPSLVNFNHSSRLIRLTYACIEIAITTISVQAFFCR